MVSTRMCKEPTRTCMGLTRVCMGLTRTRTNEKQIMSLIHLAMSLACLGLVLGLVSIMAMQTARADNFTVSFEPDLAKERYLPGDADDLIIKVKNNYKLFNATMYVKSSNTSFFTINETQSYMRIKVLNWSLGETISVGVPINISENLTLGKKSKIRIKIYDEANVTEPIYEGYDYIRIAKPIDVSYAFSAHSANLSKFNITVYMDGNRSSSQLNKNQTTRLFTSWVKILDTDGEEIAYNSSQGLSLNLSLVGYYGKHKIEYGVNTTDGEYEISDSSDIYLVYKLAFNNITAKYLGQVNYYYNLTRTVKGNTSICVDGYAVYNISGIPLGGMGEDYELEMKIMNGSNALQEWELEPHDGYFKKCFKAPSQNGNYTIELSAKGPNNLNATHEIKLNVSNIVWYKSGGITDFLANMEISQEGNKVIFNNKNSIKIFATLYLAENEEYKHLNLSAMNGTKLTIEDLEKTELDLNITAKPGTPPGKYKINLTLDTIYGKTTVGAYYTVSEEFPKNKVTYKRYYETGSGKTKITLLAKNTYSDRKASIRLIERIPKDAVKDLSFLEVSNETQKEADKCKEENSTSQCLMDLALETGECMVCGDNECWQACVNAINTSNTTWEVIFEKKPTILENDPKISWDLELSPGDEAKIVYTILKSINVSSFPKLSADVKTILIGEEKPEKEGGEQKANATENESLVIYEQEKGFPWDIVVALVVGLLIVLVLAAGIGFVVYKKFIEPKLKEKKGKARPKPEIKVPEKAKKEVGISKAKEKMKEVKPEDAFRKIGGGPGT